MFALIFAILEFVGLIIVEVFKKIFTMIALMFLLVASTITLIVLLVFNYVQ